MMKKEHLKEEDNKRKTTKCDNLDDNEKEQFRKYEKKGKTTMHDNLDDEQKNIWKYRTTKEKKQNKITLMFMKRNS